MKIALLSDYSVDEYYSIGKEKFWSTPRGLYDAFVSKIAPDGKSLVFSTFLGGNYWDFSYAVLVGSGGDIYVTGQTNSLDFPVVEPYQDEYRGGDYDAFVVKYSEGSQTGARKRR